MPKKKKSFTSIEYSRWTVKSLQQHFSYDVNDALQLLQKLLNSLALHDHEREKNFVIRYSVWLLLLLLHIAHVLH